MNATAEQKKNQRAEQLKVYQTDAEDFFVETSDGRGAYRCYFNMERNVGRCTCADYAARVKSDGDYRCKHLLAISDALINHDVEKADHIEKSKPKLDDRFISQIQGKEFVIYAGLLSHAHALGLIRLEVKTLQLPCAENNFEAICHATAESKYGDLYSDVGDANPKNVNSKIASHIIRMASTRAKARCLRDYTNIGLTCLEELGDLNEIAGGNVIDMKQRKSTSASAPAPVKPPAPVKAPAAQASPTQGGNGNGKAKPVAKPKLVSKPSATDTPAAPEPSNGGVVEMAKISVAQNRALMNLSRRRGISVEELSKMSTDMFGTDTDHLTSNDASALIRQLQTAS
jgi:predicted nucleic acid-binding Zn finger protein